MSWRVPRRRAYIRHLLRAQDQRDLGLPLARQVSGGGKKGLVNGASDANAYKAEIEKLQKIIGKQPIQIEILKKRRRGSEKSRGGQGPEGSEVYG